MIRCDIHRRVTSNLMRSLANVWLNFLACTAKVACRELKKVIVALQRVLSVWKNENME